MPGEGKNRGGKRREGKAGKGVPRRLILLLGLGARKRGGRLVVFNGGSRGHILPENGGKGALSGKLEPDGFFQFLREEIDKRVVWLAGSESVGNVLKSDG